MQISEADALALLRAEDPTVARDIYRYYIEKKTRLVCHRNLLVQYLTVNQGWNALLPRLKEEKVDGINAKDAYVCFRRRTERMQTRKVRCQYITVTFSSPVESQKRRDKLHEHGQAAAGHRPRTYHH